MQGQEHQQIQQITEENTGATIMSEVFDSDGNAYIAFSGYEGMYTVTHIKYVQSF